MSDYNSSLPIRTENAGDVIVKIADATIPSQQLKVESDGSINVNTTISATDLDIRDLVFATDKVDVSGSVVALDAPTLAALENITVSATDLDIRDLAFATDKVDVSGSTVALDSTTLAALENITVSATDLDIRNLVFATDKVDVTGSTVSLDSTTLTALENITVQNGTGASAVNIQDGGNSITVDGSVSIIATGTAVADYNTASAVAAAASSVHTYTATGNFFLTQIEASGSGKMKIVVAVNGVTKFVQFNSTSDTNMSIRLKNPLPIVSTQTITVTRTNLDKQAQDLYSTICGYV